MRRVHLQYTGSVLVASRLIGRLGADASEDALVRVIVFACRYNIINIMLLKYKYQLKTETTGLSSK